MSFDGFLMHRVIDCLKEELMFGKVNRIYQVSKYELLFQIKDYINTTIVTAINELKGGS